MYTSLIVGVVYENLGEGIACSPGYVLVLCYITLAPT